MALSKLVWPFPERLGGFLIRRLIRFFGNRANTMSPHTTQHEPPPPVLGPDDPPTDFSWEQAAYAREEERLVRDHLGKIALIHGDDVVGTYDTADEAGLEAFRLFGDVRVTLHEIR